MDYPKRIMLAGPSGIGKTTLAKAIAEAYNLPYVYGSYRTFSPEEMKTMPHKEMLNQSPGDILKRDYQVLTQRAKSFKDMDAYVTDRSYLDQMAYFVQKLSSHIPSCEVDEFMKHATELLLKQGPDLVIYVPFTVNHFKNWTTEDDGQRIPSNWYQYHTTSSFNALIEYLGFMAYSNGKETLGELGYNIQGGTYRVHMLNIYDTLHIDRMREIDLGIQYLQGLYKQLRGLVE